MLESGEVNPLPRDLAFLALLHPCLALEKPRSITDITNLEGRHVVDYHASVLLVNRALSPSTRLVETGL